MYYKLVNLEFYSNKNGTVCRENNKYNNDNCYNSQHNK